MTTIDLRWRVSGIVSTALLLACLTVSGGAAASSCLDAASERLIARGGGLEAGTCEDVGRYILVAVERRGGQGNGSFELVRARALRDVSTFFESDIAATEVLEEWEEVSSEADGLSMSSGSTYKASFRSSTESVLKGLQLHSQVEREGAAWVIYALTAQSIAVARELDPLLQSEFAEKRQAAEKLVRVQARGMAAIGDAGEAPARDLAISRALDQAIAQVLGVVVGSTVDAVDFAEVESRMFSHSVGFVEDYDIVAEGRDGVTYSVELEATVTANKLYDGYQAYLRELDSPQFFLDAGGDKTLAEPFAGFVAGLGLELADDLAAASYILQLSCDYVSVIHPVEKIPGTRALLTVAAYQADDTTELFSLANDPRKAVSFVGDGERRRAIVVDKAFQNLRDPVHRELNQLIVDMARHGRRLNAYFDLASAACRASYLQLARTLDGQGGVRQASMVIDETRDLYVLRMRYVGDGAEIAARIRDEVSSWSCHSGSLEIAYMSASEIWFTTRETERSSP